MLVFCFKAKQLDVDYYLQGVRQDGLDLVTSEMNSKQ